MGHRWAAFTEMLRCSLLGHLRNRLAMVLACVFVPVWIIVGRVCALDTVVRYRLDILDVDAVGLANRVGQVSNALSAIMLITGFMMFTETFKAGEMDRRLVLAGYSRLPLLLAKVAALFVVASVLAGYTVVWLSLFLPVEQFWPLVLALLAAGLAYGGIGLLLGSLVRGELEGFFTVVMLSLIDSGVQNPALEAANLPGLSVLPSYGAAQSALAASFTRTGPGAHPLLAVAWCAATLALTLLVFHVRTRSYRTGTGSLAARAGAEAVARCPAA
ncbi:ABC transporter permease [Streptomyces sp. CB02923]|uniref:ABC transporter permease n=1 Tax=Streptomyces sp. CB02923 TaxID=1718985 RepID=UPI00190117A0|nr:ABC transporter permease [Streptomyces sp. CB02923]